MNILGIDTSTKILCLGIMDYKNRIVEYNLNSEIRYDELIMPTIKKALRRLRLSLSEIDYFAVGLGPGYFTGLRIGMATIKGFALAFNVPVIGIPTLDILAENAISIGTKVICPLIDAKRGFIFTALYEAGVNGKLKRKSPYLLINAGELLKRLPSHKSVTFLGDGLSIYREGLNKRIKKSIFLNEENWYPNAKRLIKLALDLIEKGKSIHAETIKPIYLYPKECQIKIKNEKYSKISIR